MKRIFLMLSTIVLLFIVAGCSPSKKSIEDAVARGDYQYIENYVNNPNYLIDSSKSAVNAAAIEGLILLDRIDAAVTLYRENKGKPLMEGMIVRAFADALTKSKPQKMPEKLIELIDDDRNDNSDALLRKTAVEIEPSIGTSKIKQYVEKAINDRKTLEYKDGHVYKDGHLTFNYPQIKESLSKALLWNVKGTFTDALNLVVQQYSELEKITIKQSDAKNNLESKNRHIESRKEVVKEKEQPVKEARGNINDLRSGNPYNLGVIGCLQYHSAISKGRAFATKGREVISPYSYCLTEYQKRLKEAEDNLNQAKKELKEAIIEGKNKDIEKTIADYQSQIKAKLPEVEKAKTQLLKSLNDTISG